MIVDGAGVGITGQSLLNLSSAYVCSNLFMFASKVSFYNSLFGASVFLECITKIWDPNKLKLKGNVNWPVAAVCITKTPGKLHEGTSLASGYRL